MVEIVPSEIPFLIEAVDIWTGWGRSVSPSRDDSLLVNHFGAQVASRLCPLVKELIKDFYESDAWMTAADLQKMREIAIEQFKKRYPQIPDKIAQAFAWCYTYDYK